MSSLSDRKNELGRIRSHRYRLAYLASTLFLLWWITAKPGVLSAQSLLTWTVLRTLPLHQHYRDAVLPGTAFEKEFFPPNDLQVKRFSGNRFCCVLRGCLLITVPRTCARRFVSSKLDFHLLDTKNVRYSSYPPSAIGFKDTVNHTVWTSQKNIQRYCNALAKSIKYTV